MHHKTPKHVLKGKEEKIILWDTSVWASMLFQQFQKSTGFKTEHEITCPFPFQISSFFYHNLATIHDRNAFKEAIFS